MSKTRRDSKDDSETSSNTSEPSTSMQVAGKKRKASTKLESPRKKLKSDGKGDGPVAKGTKRKSTTESESPKKRQRTHSNNTDTSNLLRATDTITNDGEAPGTTSSCDPSVSSSSPLPSAEVISLSSRTSSSSAEVISLSSRTSSSSAEVISLSSRTSSSSAEVISLSSRTPSSSAEVISLSSRTPSPSTEVISLSSRTPSPSTQVNRSTSSLLPDRDFEGKYLQANKLGEGGFGSVYAGYRKIDNLPVAIKHIPREDVRSELVFIQGETYRIPSEVVLMLSAAGGPDSAGKSAIVTLLDWYDLDQEVVLVMERPVPSMDLFDYSIHAGPLDENKIKNIIKQLIEAAITMHSEGVFHRDIKVENILIETGSNVPRVRIIDFGCGCFVSTEPYSRFAGTLAYAPPEHIIRGSYEAAPATVWQLGALLYRLLDTDNEFSTSEYLDKILIQNWSMDEADLDVTEECQDFLMECLKVEPEERATLEQLQRHPWLT